MRSGFGPSGRTAAVTIVGRAASGITFVDADLPPDRDDGFATRRVGFATDAAGLTTTALGRATAVGRAADAGFLATVGRLARGGAALRAGARFGVASRRRAAAGRVGFDSFVGFDGFAFFTGAGRCFATRAAGRRFATDFDFAAGFFVAFAGLRATGFFFTTFFATPSPPE
jgi:hypothetical protein